MGLTTYMRLIALPACILLSALPAAPAFAREQLDCAPLSEKTKSAFNSNMREDVPALAAEARSCLIKAARNKETDESAELYIMAGVSQFNLYRFSEAAGTFDAALKSFKTSFREQHPMIREAYFYIGECALKLDQYAKALVNLQKALDLNIKANGLADAATALCESRIGMVYEAMGDYSRALDYHRSALKIYESTGGGDSRAVAEQRRNIARAEFEMENWEQARAHIAEALRLDSAQGDSAQTAADYGMTGEFDLRNGDIEKALENTERAVSILRGSAEDNRPELAKALNSAGLARLANGNAKDALECFNEAKEISIEIYGEENSSTAEARLNAADANLALGAADSALDELRAAVASLCRNNENPDSASGCKTGDLTVRAFKTLALTLDDADDISGAAAAFDNAVEALDILREKMYSEESKKLHGGEHYEMFPRMIGALEKLYAQTGADEYRKRAFLAAESGISRVFLEMLGRSKADVLGGLPASVMAEGRRLREKFASAERAYDESISVMEAYRMTQLREAVFEMRQQARFEMKAYNTRILRDYPVFADLMRPRPKSFDEVAGRTLGEGEAALEYILGEKESWLLAITDSGIDVFALPPRKKIEFKIKQFRTLLTNPDSDADELLEQAQAMYDLLVAPAGTVLNGHDSILVIPTGDIYFLPFEALAMPGDAGGEFLILKKRIRYAPSMNVLYLAGLEPEDAGETGWLGFGDPVYQPGCDDRATRGVSEKTEEMVAAYERAMSGAEDSDRGAAWCRIPGTEKEILKIASLLEIGAESESIRLGPDASESEFKRLAPEGRKYLHIAAHGALGEGGSRQPAIVLSLSGNEDSGEDGFVTMTEVLNMKVMAGLVVLSACKTGQGKMEKGEGVAGLSRAFLYAGARRLIVSLWSISDEGTVAIMEDFYKRMKDGENAIVSFTEARRAVAEKGLHPYFWAPFIYAGLL